MLQFHNSNFVHNSILIAFLQTVVKVGSARFTRQGFMAAPFIFITTKVDTQEFSIRIRKASCNNSTLHFLKDLGNFKGTPRKNSRQQNIIYSHAQDKALLSNLYTQKHRCHIRRQSVITASRRDALLQQSRGVRFFAARI